MHVKTRIGDYAGIKTPMRVSTYRAKARDEIARRAMNLTAQSLRGEASKVFMDCTLKTEH